MSQYLAGLVFAGGASIEQSEYMLFYSWRKDHKEYQ